MRLIVAALFAAGCLPFVSCTSDPDLDPKPSNPPSTSRQTPWNSPVPGQGGGAMSAMPNQQRR